MAVIFLALSSVYSFQALSAGAENKASPADKPGTEVKLLDETAAVVAAAPATAAGQSVGAAQVNVSDAGTVEMHVNETNLVEVLRMLSLQSQKNIIASKEVRGTVTANLYNVTLKEALDAILKGNGYAYREKGNFIYVYSAKELAEIEKAERQMQTEVFRLYYTPAANAVNIIKPALSAEAQVSFTAAAAVGIESNPKEAGGNAHAAEDVLVVRDYADNIEKVKKILKEVDKRPQQVLVEATIIAARLTEDNNLGIDFNIIGGVDFASFTHTAGQITGSNLADGDTEGHSVGTGNNFTSKLAPGFKVGFVSNNVSVFLNALEQTTDLAILANPKILTLNKQRGEVLVGREDGYKTVAVTETTAVQTVEFLKTGTRLIFRPFIGDDGYVRMEIHPEDSAGGVRNELPSKQTTEVTTNVIVKDGHTIVIGGLFREKSQTDRSQVPGLGNLPVVGALFRNQADNTEREEVIILLTPHIVKDERAYAKASEAELKELEKLRVGVRRGMMPWGRERLAESCYKAAVDEMSQPEPNRKKALWHLDCATNLNPKFVEAMKMKETLTGKELSAVDNSVIRGFMKRQILAERGVSAAAETSLPKPGTEPRVSNDAAPAAVAPEQDWSCQEAGFEQSELVDWAWEAEMMEELAADTWTEEQAMDQTAQVEGSEPLLETGEAGGEVAAAPATQPSDGGVTAEDATITELPTEAVDGPSDEQPDQD